MSTEETSASPDEAAKDSCTEASETRTHSVKGGAPRSRAARGPGRPPKGPVPYRVNLQVRVTEKVAEAARRLGGADFLRPLIEKAVCVLEPAAAQENAQTAESRALRFPVWKPASSDPSVKFVDMLAVCGFPSPALDYAARELSLNDYFVRHQDATYIVEAQGDSMIDAGIHEGDILIIDRSVEPRSGDIVLAYLHGDFTLKRLLIVDGVPELHPENHSGAYPVIHPGEYDDFQIEGVLIGSGRRYRK